MGVEKSTLMSRITIYSVLATVLGIFMVMLPLAPLLLRFNGTLEGEDFDAIDLFSRALETAESEGYFDGEASPLTVDFKSGSFGSSMIRFLLVILMGFIISLSFLYLTKNRLSNL